MAFSTWTYLFAAGGFVFGVAGMVSSFLMYRIVRKYDRGLAANEAVQEVEAALSQGRIVETRSARVTPIGIPDPRELLFPPPMVGKDTLKHWLMYRHRDEGVWSKVVSKFYIRALSDYRVLPVFKGYDTNEIQNKFLHTLMIVTDIGVTRSAAEGLIHRHEHLNITGDQYDAVIHHLTRTLTDYGVPQDTISQMVPMIEALRKGMVKVA